MASFTRNELMNVLEGKILREGMAKRFGSVSIDSRSLRNGAVFIAICGAHHDGHHFINQAIHQGASAVVISKRVVVKSKRVLVIRVQDTTKALGLLAGYHRARFGFPVIAITGSSGKTTTKEMIAAVLARKFRVLKNKGSFNNQWGVPLTLLEMSNRYSAAVIEVGTNHPGEIAYLANMIQPTVAVLTNVGASHLVGFKSLNNVFKEKRTLIDYLRPNGTVVFNRDDQMLSSLARLKCPKVSYGLSAKSDIFADKIMIDRRGKMCFRLNGQHQVCLRSPVMENISNALAAAACARLYRISFKNICTQLAGVRFNKHRQQILCLKGVIVIDDTYNSNPLSFRSALNTLMNFPAKGKRFVVCGDMLELGAKAASLHEQVGKVIAHIKPDYVFTFGKLSRHLAKMVMRKDQSITVFSHAEIARLNQGVLKCVSRGDIILVKGSRGMEMERVVEFLEKKIS